MNLNTAGLWMERYGVPPPGSKDAGLLGCKCAVIDNHYGAGIPLGDNDLNWWINTECPIHGDVGETG